MRLRLAWNSFIAEGRRFQVEKAVRLTLLMRRGSVCDACQPGIRIRCYLSRDHESLVDNIRFGYEIEGWDVALWSKNIFDRKYIIDKRDWGSGTVAVVDGALRSIGLDFTVRF